MSMKHRSVVYRHHLKAWVEMMRVRQAAEEEEQKVSHGETGMEDSPETQAGSWQLPLLGRAEIASRSVGFQPSQADAKMAAVAGQAGSGPLPLLGVSRAGQETEWSALSECGLGLDGWARGPGAARFIDRTWNVRTTAPCGLRGVLLSRFEPRMSHRETGAIRLKATV